MSELRKTIIHALIACALGVALGLLWDSEARAANDAKPQPYDGNIQLQNSAFELCKRTGTAASICAMKHVFGEDMAIRGAESILKKCFDEWKLADECTIAERAYIRQRWGYGPWLQVP